MNAKQIAKYLGATASLAAVVLGMNVVSHVHAESEDSLAKIGLRIAPVPLNMNGKDRGLVGLGSYLVNVAGDCNGCHSSGPPTQYAPGGNPYFAQKPAIVNPATYLGGGRDFGALIPATADIVSRNLTPDKTGKPAGGQTFAEFRTIIRTGVDMDNIHPTCSGAPGPGCLLPPFDGTLLQVMPWPNLSKMSEHDLRAIYEYLSTIPCISGPPAPSNLHNDCQ
jgi:hypothetical protein